jgi:hypothetical protein
MAVPVSFFTAPFSDDPNSAKNLIYNTITLGIWQWDFPQYHAYFNSNAVDSFVG